MDSPVLSLSRQHSNTSLSAYAPGSHRRSHLNLQSLSGLSLAPLTPKYPIDPSDYDAYFDPATSGLHTSASISHITGLPSPGGILSNSPARSRASSRARLKRKVKSSVSIALPEGASEEGNADASNIKARGRALGLHTATGTSTPSGALTSHGFGHTFLRTSHSTRSSRTALNLHHDPSWLVQTGLALTESSRENKGQSWLGKRDSSTSLASPTYHTPTEERHTGLGIIRSGRGTPNRSRQGSRNRGSRRKLAMTPARLSSTAQKAEDEVIPDWADDRSKAEARANREAEADEEVMVGEDTEGFEDENEEDDDDPYGMLNFEEQIDLDFDTDEEEEVRRELKKHGLGGWINGVVDVFLRLEEEIPDESEDAESRKKDDEQEDGVRRVVRDDRQEAVRWETVEAPPERPQGLWDDARWFGRLIARSVGS